MSNVFRLAKPDEDVLRAGFTKTVLDSQYPSPKIDTQATPPHVGLIFLNWQTTTGILDGVTLLLTSFPHNYKEMPTVFGSYFFDNGSKQINGTMPFQLGALGIIFLDTDDENVNLKYYSIDGSIPATSIPPFLMQIKFYVMAEHGYES